MNADLRLAHMVLDDDGCLCRPVGDDDRAGDPTDAGGRPCPD